MKKGRSDEATDKSLEGASLLLKKNIGDVMMVDSGMVHRLEDKCHRHNNRLTEEYRGKKYNTREHPTGMDSTLVKVF
ncbi:hypothetical protein PIB30_033146 [Stylosanthes scabra]|uniref:Uncharacterized protein n=1 Tax=Stylosanthes scabra TaxID=79078 RepID=A0ABU6XA72_9FABA|nr:hypothetical protein [Stylosanthes scabra]